MSYPSLSIVIAGPIRSRVSETDAILNIRSFKNIFPVTEIILSTYEGEVYESLFSEVNHIVYSIDPGFDSYRKWSTINRSTTRMLLTTTEGLKIAKMQLAIKSRIEINLKDVALLREKILEVFGPQKEKSDTHLVTTGPFYQSPKEYFLQPYYISDIFQIGECSRLLNGWQNALEWFQANKTQNRFQHLSNPVVPANEQILGFGFMRSIHPTKQMRGPINRYLLLFRERGLIRSFFKSEWLVIPDDYLGLESGRLSSYDFSKLSTIHMYENYLKMRDEEDSYWVWVPLMRILNMRRKTTITYIRIFFSWHIKWMIVKLRITG